MRKLIRRTGSVRAALANADEVATGGPVGSAGIELAVPPIISSRAHGHSSWGLKFDGDPGRRVTRDPWRHPIHRN